MRRNEGSGENEFSGAMAWMCDLRASTEGGWKSERSWSSVMMRVFEGGDGCERDGREVRSIDSGEEVGDF